MDVETQRLGSVAATLRAEGARRQGTQWGSRRRARRLTGLVGGKTEGKTDDDERGACNMFCNNKGGNSVSSLEFDPIHTSVH